MDIKEVRAHLDQNMLARYAAVTPVSILGFSGWPLFRRRTVPDQCPLPRLAQTWHSKIEIRDQYRCLRCLLLVMCTYPFAKKELTLHLACGEGRERYFGCNLMQRKVLASSHQHLMVEAPHELAGVDVPTKHVERAAEALGREVAEDEKLVVEPPEPNEPLAPTLYLGMDGTGVPVRKKELVGRPGKQTDGSSKTREVKLVTIWSAEGWDKEGTPVRDAGLSLVTPDLQNPANRAENLTRLCSATIGQTGWRMVQFRAIRSRLVTMNNREKQGIWAIFVPIRPFFDVVTFYISNG